MADKIPNYTQEQTDELVTAYTDADSPNQRDMVVSEFADKFGKAKQSIIAKLVSENVYIKKAYKTKRGEKPISKAAIVANIASTLGVNAETVESLEKANKAALQLIARTLVAAKSMLDQRGE